MLFEWSLDYRLIYTNGSPHETRVNPWMGDSRGRWEGDTLVVDVTNHERADVAGQGRRLSQRRAARGRALHDARSEHDSIRSDDRGSEGLRTAVEDQRAAVSPERRRTGSASSTARPKKEEANGDFERERADLVSGSEGPDPGVCVQASGRGASALDGARVRSADCRRQARSERPVRTGRRRRELRSRGAPAEPGRAHAARTRRRDRPRPTASCRFSHGRVQSARPATRRLRGYDDPTAHCFPAGVPRALYVPTPFHIVQTPDAVATLHERMQWRLDFAEPDAAPARHDRFWQGDSLGHWDGDTLVVETTNFNGKTWGSEVGDVFSYAEHVARAVHAGRREHDPVRSDDHRSACLHAAVHDHDPAEADSGRAVRSRLSRGRARLAGAEAHPRSGTGASRRLFARKVTRPGVFGVSRGAAKASRCVDRWVFRCAAQAFRRRACAIRPVAQLF